MRYIVLFFVVVPLTELYLLLWVSRWMGFWPTVALTLVTGVVGGSLAKREGLRVFRQWQASLERLEPPQTGLVEGLLVLVGGTLLLTPGVMTDAVGVLLLVPFTRGRLAAIVKARADRYIQRNVVVMRGPGSGAGFGATGFGNVIDTTGEARDDGR